MRRSSAIYAVFLGAVATGIGFACGSATSTGAGAPELPEAGSVSDDGSGLLARASSYGEGFLLEPAAPDADEGTGGDRYGNGESHGHRHGGSYDSGGFGDDGYGGALYAGYQMPQPDYSYRPSTQPYADGYSSQHVGRGGAVVGRITWPRAPSAPESLDTPDCGTIENRSLRVDRRGRVAGAVVFLSDIDTGRASNRSNGHRLDLGGMVERRNCQHRPHIQLAAPVGAGLQLVNGDDTAIDLVGRVWTGLSRDLLFRSSLPYRGAHREVTLDRDGLVRVRGDHDVDSAWIVVAGHPYYALSDAGGRFRLDDVPAGTYTLTVWHEPVVVGVDAAGRPRITSPTRVERKVRVRPLRSTRLEIDLPAVR